MALKAHKFLASKRITLPSLNNSPTLNNVFERKLFPDCRQYAQFLARSADIKFLCWFKSYSCSHLIVFQLRSFSKFHVFSTVAQSKVLFLMLFLSTWTQVTFFQFTSLSLVLFARRLSWTCNLIRNILKIMKLKLRQTITTVLDWDWL